MKNYFAIKTDKHSYLYIKDIKSKLIPIDNYTYDIINTYANGQSISKLVENNNNNTKYITAFNIFKMFQSYGFFESKKRPPFPSAIFTDNDIRAVFSDINDIVFEVTDKCNLKCDYCAYGKFYTSYDKRESQMMSLEMAIQTIDFVISESKKSFPNIHKKNISIGFYGGEPLLNFKLIEKIVAYTKNKYPSIEFSYSMTTNGLLLANYINFLVENNFKIDVSLDGDSSNNGYRVFHDGSSSFKQVFKNIFYVKEKFPDYFNKKIGFLTVLHDKNSVEEIDTFFANNFDVSVFLSELSFLGIRDEMKSEFKLMFNSMFDEFSNINSCSNKKISIKTVNEDPNLKSFLSEISYTSEYSFHNYNDIFFQKRKTMPTGTCLPFQKRLFVTVNGKYLSCESIGNKFVYGNVDKQGVHVNYVEIANSFNNYLSKFRKQCLNCYNRENCSDCMYNILDSNDKGICNNFMDYASHKEYITTLISEMEKFNRKNLIKK